MRERGFTLLELSIVVVVVSVIAAALLTRLNYYQELAEKAAMESTAKIIKTGLQIHLAGLIIANRQREAGVLERENPVQWLERKPSNYGGIYHDEAQPGTWYFDKRERQVVYVVRSGDRLEVDAATRPKQLRFRVRLLRDRIQAASGAIESVTGVTFAPVGPYRWSF